MRIAFIFAHPDDESLSAGGTIAKYVKKGYIVSTLCLTSTPERKSEYFQAIKILGVKKPVIYDFQEVKSDIRAIKEKLIGFLLDFRPEVIVTHTKEDYHLDHQSTFDVVLEAIEWAAHITQYPNAHLVSRLYTAETTFLIPNPHILVDISDTYTLKEKAIGYYKSQLSKGGEDFYIKFHKYRTLMRGTQASTEHAEAYKQISLKKNSPFYEKKCSEL